MENKIFDNLDSKPEKKFEPKVKDFGFGEVEEKKVLDPNIFEEEIEVKASRIYCKE